MSLRNYGFIVGLVLLMFPSSVGMAQSDKLLSPFDSADQVTFEIDGQPHSVQPFLPSIDDVIQRTVLETDLDRDSTHVCQLNGPETVTTVATRIDQAKCDPCKIESAAKCRSTTESATEKYCHQMSDLLVITLKGSENNPAAQRRAIETALNMVAEKAQSTADIRIADLEGEQQQLVRQMSRYAVRVPDQSSVFAHFKKWMQPIYLSQNRTHEQLRAMASNNEALKRTVNRLEQRVDRAEQMSNVSDVDRLPKPAFIRNQQVTFERAQALEAENLRRQLEVIEAKIKQLHSSPIRPVTHLEPVYIPEQQLKPVTNIKFHR